MNDIRKISITTVFFPPERPARWNTGFVTTWRPRNKRQKIYSFPTQSSLNRLAKVLCINTTVTYKPENIKVASGYFQHDAHVTEIIVTGKL